MEAVIVQGLILDEPHAAPGPGWLEIDGGRIVDRGEGPPVRADLGSPSALLCPGFIDAHLHVPQVDSIGHDGLELLDWLARVIYPAEAGWIDSELAKRQAAHCWRELLRHGTLGFAGYLTSHDVAMEAARFAAEQMPLRAVVGQVVMDRTGPPDLHTSAVDLSPIEPRLRIARSINPRFAVACSDTLLARTGVLARDGLVIQTHLAESPREVAEVDRLFPDDANYTAIYARHGLLSPRTLLAHCVHLAESEWAMIAASGAVVVHCPTANTFLRSGLFDLDAAREYGVRLALGSDIAAGPDLAMPRVGRAMIEVAKARRMAGLTDAPPPSPSEVWRLITRGNAESLGWSDAGHLTVGAAADLLVLESPFEPDAHLISRLLYNWRPEYIQNRIVAGVCVDHPANLDAPRVP